MQNALFMRGRQPGADLARHIDGFIRGQAADAAQQAGEVFAIYELHRDVVLPIHLANVVNPANVGMRHLARYANFVVEAGKSAVVAGCGFRKKLERYGLAQREVGGAIDFAHAASAQESGDTVAPGDYNAR